MFNVLHGSNKNNVMEIFKKKDLLGDEKTSV
jgi:hypothetical protein